MVPRRQREAVRGSDLEGNDRDARFLRHVEDPFLEDLGWSVRAVGRDQSGISLFEVSDQLIDSLLTAVARRAKDQPSNSDKFDQHMNRFHEPGGVVHPDVRFFVPDEDDEVGKKVVVPETEDVI